MQRLLPRAGVDFGAWRRLHLPEWIDAGACRRVSVTAAALYEA